MIVLTIRTDKPEAEVGLYDGPKKLARETWQAHRELSGTILKKITEILNKSSISADAVQGIVAFKGPGSFTGLRIGLTVANTLAYSYKIPIVARSGDDWVELGIKDLQSGQNDNTTVPEYGAPAHTTEPKK